MKADKNKRTKIMVIILLALLILAYKVMFAPSDSDLSEDENMAAGRKANEMLAKVESINFDTSVMQNESFKSLKSIETPLINLPIGRKNPFSGI